MAQLAPIVDVVLPIFAIVLAGYLVGRRGLLGDASSEALNAFVYYVALPVLLFYAMARVKPETIFNMPFLAAYLGGGIVAFALAYVVSRLMFRHRQAEGALFGMAAVFGNTGYMGIPLTLIAFGEEGQVLSIVATALQGLIWVPAVLILIEGDLQAEGAPMRRIVRVARAVAFNPMIAAPAVGILWSLGGLQLPTPFANFCSVLGAAAGPCALFALGLFLVDKPVSEGIAEVSAMVVFKLAVYPIIVAVIAFGVVDLAPRAAAIAVVLAALPAGANCFVLAQNYGTFVQRSSSAILFSTALAVATVSLLFATRYLNVR
jgi:malonate transporter